MNAALLSVILFVGSPATVPTVSTDPHPLVTAAIIAQGVGQFTDLSTTMFALGKGGFREANPILAWAEDKPVAMGMAKGLMAAGVTYGLIHLAKRKPKTALFAALGLTALQAWVTWQNAETLRR